MMKIYFNIESRLGAQYVLDMEKEVIKPSQQRKPQQIAAATAAVASKSLRIGLILSLLAISE